MIDADWADVTTVMAKLWPGSTQLNDELIRVWRKVCNHYPAAWCIDALRQHKAGERGRYFPAMPEIRDILRARSEAESVGTAEENRAKLEAARQRERDDQDRLWCEVQHAVERLSIEDREEHKRQAVAADWRLAWCANRPADCRLWIAITYKRLCADIAAHEAIPLTTPPERPVAGDRPLSGIMRRVV